MLVVLHETVSLFKSSALDSFVSGFRFAPFQNQSHSKGKLRPKFRIFTGRVKGEILIFLPPVKIKRGICEIFE